MVLRMVHHWSIFEIMEKQLILDIRPALRQRLESIDSELTDLTRRREILAALRSSVEATLNHEEAVHGDGDPAALVPALHPTGEGNSLSDALVGVLTYKGPKSLDQLKLALEKQLRDHPSPGRAINFALVGLQKGGHVTRNAEQGTWQLVSGSNRK